ncbi:MAG: VWA domain-containing protein [Eggerthellaceae bacterium]|nr:VWA domain-containing protein [Eggerthellaceae bacterium]
MYVILAFALLLASFFITLPSAAYASTYGKVADPDTSNQTAYFDSTTLDNGRLWTDKSVNTDKATLYDSAGNPAVTVNASDPDNFMVTLSALSQSYSVHALAEPIDVVFIIDISGSMYMNNLGAQTRAEVMVDALNSAIDTLMAANPENRVAIVAYGGILSVPGTPGQSRIVDVLKLGHYTTPTDGQYLHIAVTGANPATGATISVNDEIDDAYLGEAGARSFAVEGGTPTQRGIYRGAQVLLNNADTTFDLEVSPGNFVAVPRKPVMVLLTDGEPTMGWTDYQFANAASDTPDGYNAGNRLNEDMGLDLLTVATASYYKQMVHDHYYGATDKENIAWVYTIGVFDENSDTSIPDAQAVLDPKSFAGNLSQPYSGTTYYLKTLLDNLVDPAVHASGAFPLIVKNTSTTSPARSLASSLANGNAGGAPFFTSYNYTNGYYPAEDEAALQEAFRSIASDIIMQGAYTTQTDPNDPDFTGHVMFSDTLGQYMEFKGPQGFWIENQLYDGAGFAQEMVSNPGGTYWDWFVHELGQWRKASGTLTPIDDAAAEALINSCIAGGSLYYNSASDYGGMIKWYGGYDAEWLGNYYDASGAVNAPPSGTACIVELYSVKGTVYNSIANQDTDIGLASILVTTALTGGAFTLENEGSVKEVSLAAGQQNVRWYIPASLIPMRTVQEQQDAGSPGVVKSVAVIEASPIRCCYEVGLKTGFNAFADASAAYKSANSDGNGGYYFYTDDGGRPAADPLDATTVLFTPSDTNPYYSATADLPLFTDTSGTPAASYTPGATYYLQQEYFDANYPGYVNTRYVAVVPAAGDTSVSGGSLYLVAGTHLPSSDTALAKASNPTNTAARVFASSDSLTGVAGSGNVIVVLLGDNGRLNVLGLPPTPPTPPTNIPNTGDNTLAALFVCAMLMGALGAARALWARRRGH